MRLQRLHLAYLGTATQCLTRDWDCFPYSIHSKTVHPSVPAAKSPLDSGCISKGGWNVCSTSTAIMQQSVWARIQFCFLQFWIVPLSVTLSFIMHLPYVHYKNGLQS